MFWILANMFQIEDSRCGHYYNPAILLTDEIEIAKKFRDLVRVMK